MLLHEKRDILLGQFFVENALRIYDHDRAFRTKAVTSCGYHLHFFRKTPVLQFCFQTLPHLQGTAGNTACSGTYHEMCSIRFHPSTLPHPHPHPPLRGEGMLSYRLCPSTGG